MTLLRCADRVLDLSRPQVMGILNVTPDSFSDGGRFVQLDAALRHAEQLLAEGAALIDVGAESTRPGAAPVSEQEELDRLLPVVEAIASRFDTVVSIDTSTPVVMREAAQRGAGFINDVRALSRPDALVAAAETGLPVCLTHMQGEPAVMQQAPRYDDVLAEVRYFLAQRAAACLEAGIAGSHILYDPGFGFGKSLAHNLRLLQRLDVICDDGHPVLVGMSRKRMLGEVLGGAPLDGRLHAGLAAALLAVERGARIVRVHEVRPMVEALALWQAQHDVEEWA